MRVSQPSADALGMGISCCKNLIICLRKVKKYSNIFEKGPKNEKSGILIISESDFDLFSAWLWLCWLGGLVAVDCCTCGCGGCCWGGWSRPYINWKLKSQKKKIYFNKIYWQKEENKYKNSPTAKFSEKSTKASGSKTLICIFFLTQI